MSTYPLTMSVLGVNVRDSVAVTAVPPEYGYCLIVTVTVRLTVLLPQVPELIRNTVYVPSNRPGSPPTTGTVYSVAPLGVSAPLPTATIGDSAAGCSLLGMCASSDTSGMMPLAP